MRFKNIFLLAAGLLAGPSAWSQLPDSLYQGRLILKIAPLSTFFDPHQTYQVGAEYFVRPRLSIQQEVGYGRYNLFPHASNGLADPTRPGSVQVVGQQVWRYRVEVRRHRPVRTNRFTDRPRPGRPYVAYEFLAKRVCLPQTSDVGRDCDGGACAYTERISYTNVRHVYALHFKLGKQFIWDRFVLDYYGGIGWRVISTRNWHVPDDARLNVQNGEDWGLPTLTANIRRPGVYSLPSASLGLKLGILCGKVPRQLRNNAQ